MSSDTEQNGDLTDSSSTQTTCTESCKMFVGGLNWRTTPDTLRQYFSSYGEITDCSIVKDPITRKSKCFGFITFTKPDSLEQAISSGPHRIDEKNIDAKHAANKNNNNSEFGHQGAESKPASRTRKIFVGGLSAQTTIDDIKAYFNQYGQIENAMLMIDKYTQRHRGFAFVTFESDLVVERVCEIHFHEINNKMVECKPAQPREELAPTTNTHGYTPNGYAGINSLPTSGYTLGGIPTYIGADMLGYPYAGMCYPTAGVLDPSLAALLPSAMPLGCYTNGAGGGLVTQGTYSPYQYLASPGSPYGLASPTIPLTSPTLQGFASPPSSSKFS